jgi:hypothetical protein
VCIFVDGAKFIYNSDMDKKITINCVENVITMTRIDGIQLNIDTKIIEGFPFNYEQFSDKFIKVVQDIPQDHVKVEN